MRGFGVLALAVLLAIGSGVGMEAAAGPRSVDGAIDSMLQARSVQFSVAGRSTAPNMYQAPSLLLVVLAQSEDPLVRHDVLIDGTHSYALTLTGGGGGAVTCQNDATVHPLFPLGYSVAELDAFLPLLLARRADAYVKIGDTYEFSVEDTIPGLTIRRETVTVRNGHVTSAWLIGTFGGSPLDMQTLYSRQNAAPEIDLRKLLLFRGGCRRAA